MNRTHVFERKTLSARTGNTEETAEFTKFVVELPFLRGLTSLLQNADHRRRKFRVFRIE
jgi:hypothetical protein